MECMSRRRHALHGHSFVPAATLCCAAWLLPVPLAAQSDAPKVIRLAPPSATLAEEFTVIAAVRELRDGRVLVSDERDGRLVVADLASGAVTSIGRKGAGPGEYVQLGRIWPLGADSTLVKEPFSPRWLLLRAATVVATLGAGDPAVALAGRFPLMGTDTLGGVVALQFGQDAAGRPSLADSLSIVRVDRRSLRVDTLARVQSGEGWARSAGVTAAPPALPRSTEGAAPRRYVLSLLAPDQLAVFPDGWIAIARVQPYRVDWCAPGRECDLGRPIPEPRLSMTAGERQAYLEVARRTHSWPPTTDVEATSGWPNVIPPFVTPSSRIDAGAVWALPDGRVLIERLPTAAAVMMRYDIVSRRGVREAQLQLPLGTRVVGFGARAVYVAETDEDGVQRLRRHPWP